MSNITFNEKLHEYKIDGNPVKSVTEILKIYGLAPKFWSSQAAMRGTYVHKAIHLFLLDNLDEDSLSPALRPYFESWKKWFLAQEQVDTHEAEYIVGSLLYGLAGTLDFWGVVNGKNLLIDWKGAKEVYFHHWLQIELYRRLLKIMDDIDVENIGIVHIQPEETKLIFPEDREKINKVVDSILVIQNCKARRC